MPAEEQAMLIVAVHHVFGAFLQWTDLYPSAAYECLTPAATGTFKQLCQFSVAEQ